MKVLIVGGVAGGATCAARLRRLSETIQIKLFEKGGYVSFANCGLPYYIGSIIQDRNDLLLSNPKMFKDRFGIDVAINHQVLSVDKTSKTIQVQNLETKTVFEEAYDYLVLSTGSNAFKPPIPGIDGDGIFTLRSIEDSDQIKQWIQARNAKSAVIVGGGFIGLEMMDSFAAMGMKVDVVENGPQIMNMFDSEMVNQIHKHIIQKGVGLHLKTAVTRFDQEGGQVKVTCGDGTRFMTDLVIVAIGARPEISLAKQAGLTIGQRGGILVNEKMQTSDPSIYAAGDSVESVDFITHSQTIVPLANPANRQGRVAADNIVNPSLGSKYRGVQGTSICKVFDLTMACTGASEKTLTRNGTKYEKVFLFPFHHVSYYPGASRMMLKVLFSPTDGLILGAQCVGKHGVDKRIDVISTAIQGRMTIHDLEEVELCYAPQFGAGKDPINLAGMIGSNLLDGSAPVVHWTDPNVLDGSVQLLDVRNPGEVVEGCAPGALTIPLPHLRARLGELDRSKRIHVYCAVGQRGYYATRILRLNGFDAHNISGGYSLYKEIYQ